MIQIRSTFWWSFSQSCKLDYVHTTLLPDIGFMFIISSFE